MISLYSEAINIIEVLKNQRKSDVKILLARRLADGARSGDCEEIFYWSVIHYGVFGGHVDTQVHLELLNSMKTASIKGQ